MRKGHHTRAWAGTEKQVIRSPAGEFSVFREGRSEDRCEEQKPETGGESGEGSSGLVQPNCPLPAPGLTEHRQPLFLSRGENVEAERTFGEGKGADFRKTVVDV